MVFGWGKKKPESKPEPQIETVPKSRDVSISDVPKIVDDLQYVREKQAILEIKNLRNSTSPLIDELKSICTHLEDDSLKVDDIDKHLAIIVVRGKQQVIDIMKKEINTLVEISSIDDAKKLDHYLDHILKKVGDVLGRQTRVIHIFAKKYANQLKNNLEVIQNNQKEIHSLLENYDENNNLANRIKEDVKEFSNLGNQKSELESKINNVNSEIQTQDKKLANITSSIEEIKSSSEYQKFQDSKKLYDNFVAKKSDIIDSITMQFTKISRPLSRYEYASSLDKEQKSILTKLNETPFDVMSPENKDGIIIILENIKKSISSGSISVKDQDKTLEYITETEEMLEGFIKSVSEFHQKCQEIKSETKNLEPISLSDLTEQQSKTSDSIVDLKQKLDMFQTEIKSIDDSFPKIKSQIEKNLRLQSKSEYRISAS
jgi:chromosome segregation ATPase